MIMGVFSVDISVGDTAGGRWQDLSAIVDTGAVISSVPGSILRYLGVSPAMRQSVRLADGSRKTVDIGYTWLRFNGQRVMTYIAFNDETSSPLLGALTLEELWVRVDPLEGRLIPLTDMPL